MNVAKNWALTIMLIALAFAHFSSELILKEQMVRKTCGEWRRSEFFQHCVKFGTLSFITVLFANCFCQVFIYLMALRNLQFLSLKSSKKENSHPFIVHWFNLKSWFRRIGHKLWNKCYTYSQVFRHLRKVLKGLAFSNVPFIQN